MLRFLELMVTIDEFPPNFLTNSKLENLELQLGTIVYQFLDSKVKCLIMDATSYVQNLYNSHFPKIFASKIQ